MDNPNEPQPDWRQGYGFQFWMARHGYRGDGAYGQFCVVLPEQDVVIATTAATEDMQGILDAAWAHLLPAMADSTVEPSPVAGELTDRLSGLRLEPLQAQAGSGFVGADMGGSVVRVRPADGARRSAPSPACGSSGTATAGG